MSEEEPVSKSSSKKSKVKTPGSLKVKLPMSFGLRKSARDRSKVIGSDTEFG